MTTTQDINAMLMGSGGRSAKFEHEGDTVIGHIVRIDTRQQTEIGSGAPRTWPDGNPRMQLVVTLDTGEQVDDDDDGMRNLYVPIPSAMQRAIADAVRRSGANGLANGGKLGVKHTKVDKPKQRGFNGQKLYSASYEAPTVSVMDDDGVPPIEEDDLPF